MLLLLTIAGVVVIVMAAGKTAESEKKLAAAERDLKAALTLAPAPTETNLEASEANIQELKAALAKQIASTQGRNATLMSQRPPLSGTDMFYDLVAYKNELDRDARNITPVNATAPGIKLPANFDWGFSRFLQAGAGQPPPEQYIPQIFRQKLVINYLIRKLMATGPQSIVSIQREPIVVPRSAAAQPRAGGGGAAGGQQQLRSDEFFPTSAETVAIPGAIETMAFRITFTGYTQNLRTFLKDIASFELPLVVRSVDVKPADAAKPASGSAAATPARTPASIFDIFGRTDEPADTADTDTGVELNQEPVVEQNISQFSILVEYIDVTIKS